MPARSRPREVPDARYGFLTVGQTATIVGVSPSTRRLWENDGLVAPQRTAGRRRLSGPELLGVLERIEYRREVQRLDLPCLRRAWFPSTHSHRWVNPGDRETVLLWIDTPPTF
jgi:hypothetical protein